jgi:APA family basic amino acid/polyamine antiporter
MISIAVLILRIKQPQLDRPFKTPLIWFVAPAGALFNIGLMSFVRLDTWIAFFIWTGLGVIVYFLYSRKNSNLNDPNYLASLRGHDAIVHASEDAIEQDPQ